MKEKTVRIGNMEVKIVTQDDDAEVREIIGERCGNGQTRNSGG